MPTSRAYVVWLWPLLLAASGASAEDATLELLAKKGLITAEEYQKLKDAEKDQATVSLRDGFRVTSADGSASLALGTLLQADGAVYFSTTADLNNGSELRRARLSMSGTFLTDFEYKTEVDFATTTQVTDAYVTWHNLGPLDLTIGNFKIPFSQELVMQDKQLMFMERSLPSANIDAPRAPGLMLSAGGDQWSSALGIFGEQLSFAAKAANDERGILSFRATYAPLIGAGHTVHLGLSAALRWPTQANNMAGDGETLRLRSKPESNITDVRLVDTGEIPGNVSHNALLGLEAGASLGSWTINAEYFTSRISRDTGPNLDFHGWYAQAGWMLTGEQRGYRGDKGLFEGIRPATSVGPGGRGALELAVRYSELDLTDRDVTGGEEQNLTAGVNWYLNPFLRLTGNYVQVLKVRGGKYDGDGPAIAQLRFQLAY